MTLGDLLPGLPLDPRHRGVAVAGLTADSRGVRPGFAFFAVLLLYGQLLTYGYWVAAGVVEEKSSRVIEIMLSALRPRQLLAGKVIGLGLLALGHLTLIALIGLGAAAATGALDVTGERAVTSRPTGQT